MPYTLQQLIDELQSLDVPGDAPVEIWFGAEYDIESVDFDDGKTVTINASR